MGKIKVKTINRQTKPQLTFSEWAKNHYAEGRYLVRRIFPPRQYPSAAVIFETENAYVKMNIDPETWKAVAKDAKLVKGSDVVGTMYAVVEKDDVYTDFVAGSGGIYTYDRSKNIWQYRPLNTATEAPEDDDAIDLP